MLAREIDRAHRPAQNGIGLLPLRVTAVHPRAARKGKLGPRDSDATVDLTSIARMEVIDSVARGSDSTRGSHCRKPPGDGWAPDVSADQDPLLAIEARRWVPDLVDIATGP